MAAISRLQQRIKENFQETTRDISLLAGGGGSATAAYFDTSDEKIKEISKLLESRLERERLEGMKRIIAGMSKGRDMEPFFAQVVKNVVAPSIEIRKLVYIYLLRFASTNSDLLLLSINTFQKDLSDSSPLIRSMSLRVLTSIRVPVIQGIVMLGLKKLVNDRNPYVRKVVAGGLAKVYEMDTSALSQLLPLLQTLLASPSPLTLGPTLTAFLEMCPDRLDLLHPYYRHICRLIVDADEWGQCVALEVLTRYARTMLEKPETAGSVNPSSLTKKPKQVQPVSHPHDEEDSEDEFEGLEIDLAMLLHCSKPLFQSRNPAVVLATATMFYHLAPAGHALVGQELLVAPLLRLASGSDRRRAAGEEIAALTWEVVAGIAEERPWLLNGSHGLLYLHSSDSVSVKLTKIKVLTALVSAETAQASVREFKHYARDQNDAVAEAAVKAIGHCVRTQSEVAVAGLSSLMKLLKSDRGCLVAQAVIVLKSVIMSLPSTSTGDKASLPSPQLLVARLAKGLDGITNPSARASVYWLVGQYAASDEKPAFGIGWEGIASWVPDILRKGAKGFTEESITAKLQIITLLTKVMVLSPPNKQLGLLAQYLFSLARYDADYDVRDRARFLHALMRGVRDEKKSKDDEDPDTVDEVEEAEEQLGGVVLRREQVKVVVLGTRDFGDSNGFSGSTTEYQVGSMSRITQKRLTGYEEVPEWTDDPTDASLRESEVGTKSSAVTAPVAPVTAPTSSLPGPSVPTHLSSSPSVQRSSPSSNASPVGSMPTISHAASATNVKAKFKDLDKFLDSESETEEEDSEDDYSDDAAPAPAPVTAPPRSAIVPEYDTSSGESEEETDESDQEADGKENAPLYGQYR